MEFGLKKNPVEDVSKSTVKEKAGERFLSPDEVKDMWEVIDRSRMDVKTKATIKLMLATGQRVIEVRRLIFFEIDLKEKLWELDKTKPFRPHVIPLTDIAIDIIKELTHAENGLLLSIGDAGELIRFDVLNRACKRLCENNNIEKFTPRDLRRTWKTLSGKVGITKFDRDKYQNHKTYDTSSKHYDRYDYLAEKRWVAIVWNQYLKIEFNKEYLKHISHSVSLEPEIITQAKLLLVGMKTQFYSVDSEKNNIADKLPLLWDEFLPRMDEIEYGLSGVGYGVIQQTKDKTDLLEYYAVREVTQINTLPEGMVSVKIPKSRYAKFTHEGDIKNINNTVNYIYSSWLLQAGKRHTYGADLEIYGEGYIPDSDDSVVHYAIPIIEEP